MASPALASSTAPSPGARSATGLERSPFLRACYGLPVPRTPVWFMRQAGRSLPEYRALREGASLLELCRRPELAAEATLQPVRRLGVDAAILFSDIVLPLAASGVELKIVPEVGPVIDAPLRSADDIARLRTFQAQADAPYLAQAVRLACAELGDVPLIGFAGGPYTLASYLIEGGPSKTHARTRALMYAEGQLWSRLLHKLADTALSSLRAQVSAGASAVQLFDSWAGTLDPESFRRHVLPAIKRIFSGLEDLGVPRIYFAVGAGALLGEIAQCGAEVIGVDWRTPLDRAREIVGPHHALQGNLDPAACLAPWPALAPLVDRILAHGGRSGHIFNLGHGVLPETDPQTLRRVVERVAERSSAGPIPAAAPRAPTAPPGARPAPPYGVLLMAYGTPATIDRLSEYYTHIRHGNPPHPAQLQALAARYEAIGGLSPLLEITREQASGLQQLLSAEAGATVPVVLGMKHAQPFIEDGVAELLGRGVRNALGLVLAPHYSALSIGEYIDRARAASDARLEIDFVRQWHRSRGYVDLLAERLRSALAGLTERERADVEIVFTAHSLPERILAHGDPYPGQLQATARAVAAALRLERYQVAFQSAGRTEERWLGPDILQAMSEAAAGGRSAVLVCPAGFVSDHLEILYDLDIECREHARTLGIGFARTELPNADPQFLEALAEIIRARRSNLSPLAEERTQPCEEAR
ncbi:MAG TPA: uroporphyrinogen decarboxylase [Solirubrobacteraceae bacterium]|nr:uroporphyrinogen decarboxylase [Solirubrobacteraceae bacterium]